MGMFMILRTYKPYQTQIWNINTLLLIDALSVKSDFWAHRSICHTYIYVSHITQPDNWWHFREIQREEKQGKAEIKVKIQGPFICHDRWPVPFIKAPLTDREILSDHCTHFPLSTCFPLDLAVSWGLRSSGQKCITHSPRWSVICGRHYQSDPADLIALYMRLAHLFSPKWYLPSFGFDGPKKQTS